MVPVFGPTSPSSAIQRVTSRGDSKLVIGDQVGVISVVAAGSGFAHTIIYIEKADESWKLDLTAGGLASSGNDSERPSTLKSGDATGLASGASGTATVSGTGLTVNFVEASASDLALFASTSTKRSWSVSNAQLDAALQLGRDMSANADQYVYKLGGTGLTGSRRKANNCARFGEEILKAAGVSASSGIIFNTPAELAIGKKRFFKPKSKQAAPNLSKLEWRCPTSTTSRCRFLVG